MKTCTKCGLSQSLESFYKDRLLLRSECKSCTKASRASHYKENRGAVLRYQNLFYAAHRREKIEAQKRRDAEMPREAYLKRFMDYRTKNREHKAAQDKAYCRAHPEYVKARFARHEARKRGAAGSCTTEQLKARFDLYGNCCAYCGGAAESADHVIPLSRGGPNFPANIRPACRKCNSSKGAKQLSEWRPSKAA